jgi:hypothetical protein
MAFLMRNHNPGRAAHKATRTTEPKVFVHCCQCSREVEMVPDKRRTLRPPDGWLEVLVKEVPLLVRVCPTCIMLEPRITPVGLRPCGAPPHTPCGAPPHTPQGPQALDP